MNYMGRNIQHIHMNHIWIPSIKYIPRIEAALFFIQQLLDYETRSSYSFVVEVANPVMDARYLRKGPFKDQAIVRVMVLNADEPPRFSQARYHLDVSENCPPVCSVGRVYAVDPDTGQSNNIRWLWHHHSLIYSLTVTHSPFHPLSYLFPPCSCSCLFLHLRYSIDPQSDPEALFRIASDTGFISTVMELDREQEQWHNITVIATQRGMSAPLPSGHYEQQSLLGSYFTKSTAWCWEYKMRSKNDRDSVIISTLASVSFSFRQSKSCVKGCGCHRDTGPEWQCTRVGQAVRNVCMWLQCPWSGLFYFCFCFCQILHLTSVCFPVFTHSVLNFCK